VGTDQQPNGQTLSSVLSDVTSWVKKVGRPETWKLQFPTKNIIGAQHFNVSPNSPNCGSLAHTLYFVTTIFEKKKVFWQPKIYSGRLPLPPLSQWHYVRGITFTDQWRRRVCRNADSPSISSRMATVSTAQIAQAQKSTIQRIWLMPCMDIGICMKKCHSTSDSSVTVTRNHKHVSKEKIEKIKVCLAWPNYSYGVSSGVWANTVLPATQRR